MTTIKTIRARIIDMLRERRIRSLMKRRRFHLTTALWLQREADDHKAEFRALNAALVAEDRARSASQILRMARTELHKAKRAGDLVGIRVWRRRVAELEAQGRRAEVDAASAALAALASVLPAPVAEHDMDAQPAPSTH